MNQHLKQSIIRVVLPYIVFAGLWILLSDKVLDALVTDPVAHTQWSISKGWAFILVTAILLASLLRVESWTREQSEEALREKERRLSESQRIAHIGSWLYDLTGRLTWSDELYRIYGVSPDTFPLSVDSFLTLIHPDDRAEMQNWIADCVAGKNPKDFEFRIIFPDGTVRFISGRGELLFDQEHKPTHIAGTAQDITSRKEAEEVRAGLQTQLIQAQKLESIGTLASGVAHEINNPIMGIMGYAQMIRESVDPKSPIAEYATGIVNSTERVNTLSKNLLSFARVDKQPHEPARLCDVVDSTLSLIRAMMRHDQITLKVDIPADLPVIKCRAQQIQQVIMNLLTNARDALNEKYPESNNNKQIIISGSTVRHTANGLEETINSKPALWVRLTVEDHGMGIPEALRKHIIDPFFTTKPRDKGTGLGLSISHGIVKDHNGELWFESEAGQWTKFHVDLPVERNPA